MAHFAQLDDNDNVINVVVIADSDCIDSKGKESEFIGSKLCNTMWGGRWIQTSFTGRIRKRFAAVGMQYLQEHDVFVYPREKPWHELNSDYEWHNPPLLNPETGIPFTEDELHYIMYVKRLTKSYRFCPAIPKDPKNDFLSKACTSNEFMYPTYEDIMYGTNRTKTIIEATVENKKIVIPFVFTLLKEVDVTPVGIILESKWENVHIENANNALNSHPQTAARTRQELFRLIIEWAFAHTDLGNNEPAAVGCHNLLRVLQMPLDVRNEILEQIEPQAVERYLRGLDPFTATSFDVLSDPPSPPMFSEWYQQKLLQYPPIFGKTRVNVYMSEVPEDYPQ